MEYLFSVVFAQQWPRLFVFFTAIVWSLLRTPLLHSSVVEYLPSIYKGLGPILSTEKDGGKEERGKEYHEMETTLQSSPGSQQHCHATLTSLLFTPSMVGAHSARDSNSNLCFLWGMPFPSKPIRLVFLDFILSPDPELISSRGQAFFAGLWCSPGAWLWIFRACMLNESHRKPCTFNKCWTESIIFQKNSTERENCMMFCEGNVHCDSWEIRIGNSTLSYHFSVH